MEFCQEVMEKANLYEMLISNILFSDESSFSIHGHFNPSITVRDSRENRHISLAQRLMYGLAF